MAIQVTTTGSDPSTSTLSGAPDFVAWGDTARADTDRFFDDAARS